MSEDLIEVTEKVLKEANKLDVLAFHLKIEKDMSETEISKLLGITRQNVILRLKKIYDKIRELC